MKFIILILVLVSVSCEKKIKDIETFNKPYEIRGDVTHSEEAKVISLLSNKHSLSSITQIEKIDTNLIQALVKRSDEERTAYIISYESNEWGIIMHSEYKVIKGFVVASDIYRTDIDAIIDLFKNKKPPFSEWVISKESKGIIEVVDVGEGIGITYRIAKKNGSWKIIQTINWET